MTVFRRLVFVLVMFALPMQGAIASARWLCAAAPHGAPQAESTHDHRMHASPARDGAAQPHAMHDGHSPGTSQGAAQDSAEPSATAGGCNPCAACCVTAATPPASAAVPAAEATDARFPALSVPVPRIAADGLERPPRTV